MSAKNVLSYRVGYGSATHHDHGNPATLGAGAPLGDYAKTNRSLSEAGANARMVDRIVNRLAHQKHGTENTYKCGCRCEDCVASHNTYRRAYQARRRAKAKEVSK